MIKRDYEPRRPVIDLSSPEGNVFVLMRYVYNFGRQLNWSDAKIDEIIEKMKSDDYTHAVAVFEMVFGEVVEIIASEEQEAEILTKVAELQHEKAIRESVVRWLAK